MFPFLIKIVKKNHGATFIKHNLSYFGYEKKIYTKIYLYVNILFNILLLKYCFKKSQTP